MIKKTVLTTSKPPALLFNIGDHIYIEEVETRWWVFLICALVNKPEPMRKRKYRIVAFDKYEVTLEKGRWWAPVRDFNPKARGSIPRSPSSVISEEVEA